MQRRLALLGDGIGHVALTGVALGFLTGTAPVLTAVVVVGARRGRHRAGQRSAAAPAATSRSRCCSTAASRAACCSSGSRPGGSNATLISYLFGSITSVTELDLWVIGGLAVAVLAVVALFGRELFVLCQDEEVAKASGLPVRFLSLLIAVTAALTVVIAMRVVGLLLVSALMVVPVADEPAAHPAASAPRMLLAMAFGVVATVGGLTSAFYADVAPGAAIVLIALAGFGAGARRG